MKGYASHEQDVLERVVEARAVAAANDGAHEGQIRDEQRLAGELRQLLAVAESYPDLKADARFRDLQHQLAETEDRIAAIRRLHNANVRRWNTLGETVPWRFLRGLVSWEHEPYFEVEDPVRTTVPGFERGTAD
ncbi:LemA family protein [Egibacter rhizosphaerae]|uniref:LemA family protein n=1 Tax=Egibacter rhizosphaerae TaxID=1670831 RepID=UPI001F0E4329|nr:LemA family protein [Egibacter rhizosphaerae]